MKNSAGNRLGSFARFSLMALVGLALAGGAAAVRGQSALDGFDPNADNNVYVVVVQPDGKILIGGTFTTVLGVARNKIARLNPDGTLDTAFNPNANATVFSIAVQADGKILVGGTFNGASSIGGQPRNHIARLDATTGLADSFDPNANSDVRSIVVQADGKILAGGTFNGANSIGGHTRNHIARLDAATGLADSFDPNANGSVAAIAVQADGKILVGGFFGSIGGQTRSVFARLSNDTAALQNLAVTQTTVTWTRGGSSAQFIRVTFESSIDNVTYTVLGNGTASGSNWTLTGLNLSTGQNLYIRARGYYRTGYDNASESTQESVRNAFLQPTGSATWKSSPATGDWNTASNWSPATVPNGASDTATFASSSITNISLSANTEVNGIVFNSGASAFTITTGNGFTLTISGAGIMNNSGLTENLSATGGSLLFKQSATAANARLTSTT